MSTTSMTARTTEDQAANSDCTHSQRVDADSSQLSGAAVYELFVLGLCVYVLVALAVETFLDVEPAVQTILMYADTVVCCVFMADFFGRFFTAKSKLHYMLTWGWIDFLSSVPLVGPLRFGRLARIARVLRLLRGFRSIKMLVEYILRRRAQSASMAAGLTSLLLVVFSSIAVLHFERGQGGSINNPEDAMWWAFTTVSSVGYGDRYPVTRGGRVVAVFAMCTGVCLFATLTGLVATWFLSPTEVEQEKELEAIRIKLTAIEKQLDRLVSSGSDRSTGEFLP